MVPLFQHSQVRSPNQIVLTVKVEKMDQMGPSALSVLPLSRVHHLKTEIKEFQFKNQKLLMERSTPVSLKNHARSWTAGLLKANLNAFLKRPIGER